MARDPATMLGLYSLPSEPGSGSMKSRRRSSRAHDGVRTLLALLLAGAGGVGCAEQQPSRAPSILLLSLDTLRADHVGTFGYERETTPFLDAFAEKSLVFEHALSPAPWTLISHMTMLTGLYPHQHGVVTGDWALADATPLLAQRLSRAGYQTIGLYYEGWIHARHGFDRGFDHFESHASVREAEQHLERVLDDLDPARPFFLFLHLFDIHCGPLDPEHRGPIYDCPAPYDSMFVEGASELLPDMPEGKLWLYKGDFSSDALRGLTALYDGGIRYVDDTLRRWFADLERRGLLEEMLVIITSDHGESLGQRGNGINDHGGAYQEGLHVPLLVHLPGQNVGRRVVAPAHLVDIVPTILKAAGLPADARLPGRILTEELPPARPLLAENPASFEMVVDWPHKYVHLIAARRTIEVDLEEDPEELVGRELDPSAFEHRRGAVLEGLAAWPPAQPVNESEYGELEERLQEMGYAGDVRGED